MQFSISLELRNIRKKMNEEFKKELLETQKSSNIDDVIDTHILEPLGLVFAKLFIKLKMKPNLITILSCIIGVAGGILLAFDKLGIRAIGIGLLIISAIFDCSDGQVARITKQFSPIGRTLDGLCDGIVQLSIYVSLGIRLMNSYIPFTFIRWEYWIFVLLLLNGLLHLHQERIADFYRNLHMFFINDNKRHELDRSKNIDYSNAKGLNKAYLFIYKSYVKLQERETPQTQVVLDKYETTNSEAIRNVYRDESPKIIRLCNALTINLRSIVLYLLILFNLEPFIFAFVLLVIEPIAILVTSRYNRIAKKAMENNE